MKQEEDVNVDNVRESARPSQRIPSRQEEFDSFIDRTLIVRHSYLFQRRRRLRLLLLRIGLLDR